MNGDGLSSPPELSSLVDSPRSTRFGRRVKRIFSRPHAESTSRAGMSWRSGPEENGQGTGVESNTDRWTGSHRSDGRLAQRSKSVAWSCGSCAGVERRPGRLKNGPHPIMQGCQVIRVFAVPTQTCRQPKPCFSASRRRQRV